MLFTFYVLRFTFYALRFTFYVLRFTSHQSNDRVSLVLLTGTGVCPSLTRMTVTDQWKVCEAALAAGW